MLVLVRRVAPGEALLVLAPRVVDQQQVRQEGREAPAVRDVDLHAVAQRVRVLLEGGGEGRGAEADARDALAVERARERVAVEPGGAHELERPRGAAGLGQVGALDQAAAGVDERGVHGRDVGGGQDPGQAGVLVLHRPAPALHRHDVEVDVEGELLAEHQRELARRHPVAHDERVQADEGAVLGVEDVALDRVAADRVRPVEHDDPLLLARAGLHHVQHRVDERVVARAHVLHVEHHRVDPGQHLRGGHAGLAVEAVDREPRLAVARVAHLDEVLRVRRDAVLGTEEGRELHAAPAPERDRGVLEVARDRGRVDDEPDAQAAHRLGAVEQAFEPGEDARHAAYSTNCSVKRAGGLPARSIVPVTVLFSSVPRKRNAVPCRSTVKLTLAALEADVAQRRP